jgi:hypothetical protein
MVVILSFPLSWLLSQTPPTSGRTGALIAKNPLVSQVRTGKAIALDGGGGGRERVERDFFFSLFEA